MPVRGLRELEGELSSSPAPWRGHQGRRREVLRNLYDVRGAIEGMLTERCAEIVDAAGIRS
jgi:hypothetical protein